MVAHIPGGIFNWRYSITLILYEYNGFSLQPKAYLYDEKEDAEGVMTSNRRRHEREEWSAAKTNSDYYKLPKQRWVNYMVLE